MISGPVPGMMIDIYIYIYIGGCFGFFILGFCESCRAISKIVRTISKIVRTISKLAKLFLKLSELFLKLSELFLNLQNYF